MNNSSVGHKLVFIQHTDVAVSKCVCVCIFSQEVFYLTYTPEDVEGNTTLDTGDKVSFYVETNKQ